MLRYACSYSIVVHGAHCVFYSILIKFNNHYNYLMSSFIIQDKTQTTTTTLELSLQSLQRHVHVYVTMYIIILINYISCTLPFDTEGIKLHIFKN